MPDKKEPAMPVSRRAFIKGLGTTAVATAASGTQALAGELEKVNQERVLGPDAVSVSFLVNGGEIVVDVEPNETLLDVLRDRLSLTGAKEICGRGTCGGCTVLIDDTPVYGCMYLAIEAHGKNIVTVEGLADGETLSPLQEAFIDEDGMMCGYCTSGFLVTLSALLKENPTPDEDEIKHAVSGHLCRCGTYPRIVRSTLRASGTLKQSSTEVISLSHVEKLA
jgi:aerobic-type carbon monoxide dehydrogenase small subunit (CoxS/CutS family)